jgi:cephalosporin-C deacetylase
MAKPGILIQMILKQKNSLALALILFFGTMLFTAKNTCSQVGTGSNGKNIKISLDVNDNDGVIYNEKTIQAFAVIKNTSEKQMVLQVRWRILTDNHHPLFDVTVPQKVKPNSSLTSYCPLYQFQEPGFYQIKVEVATSDGEIIRERKTVGVDPEKISAPLDAAEDFDSFWKNALKELKTIQPETKILPVKREENARTNLFKVEIKSADGLTVRGWLEVPKKTGKYPALLRVPGYTENLTPIDKYDDLIVFSFNTRDHGESDNTGKRGWDMWVRGMHDKNEFYYKDIILDCIQALNYLCRRNDVDTNRIAVWGGSQGGGLSFTTAALDKRISLCIADIPFLCEYPRYLEISHWDEIDVWFTQNPKQTWTTLFRTLSYFDTKNMAGKITCPVVMGIGLQDDVCPPATSFVTYNYLNCPKEYSIYKYEQHSQPNSHYENRFKKIREAFQMD